LAKTGRIQFKYCWIDRTDFGCITRFFDGATVKSLPHPEDPHYTVIAHRTGCGDDLHRYAREHDAMHHLLAEWLFDAPSPGLWGVAHGKEVTPSEAAIEECGVHVLQAWVRCSQEPIISGVDWHSLKHKAVKLLRNWE
jgi:hypothetical protein